ncbi:MAG: hypothetical protein COV41_00680 [Candidatus Brennerbacteria bacterium CG11_big_fil_rev_8_21_14_0_20_43_10]|uniref:Uncharacterized protein n=3 Tax=Candidatus Brenneribacteriota TaxID=1817902 RepID=A0A2M8C184_9BACT|nr:MAG: hypothetical protein AUJ43_00430 [Parcubacteria group bacterium CG1_02_44_31]PIP50354.1 MAG: hypothetical protein COX12_01775 [Candidatus Brennerbacteria bacterium CG23_combo_of_CG06-09_8_20_14_all_44_41]PIR26822.1 MAG: hypothetical protein COV41_00680 [Candidatus Brennerbacteria bacterium CG11_big_fil_rev_8_21_14_0_20_43_10]PIX29167.1 MAG: hypothetical protein COZ64_00900 [Candidatus Brennerbacteria bacterium CG_4_8_14_3_um_filter_43_14]PJA19166.1 MAG: hypothetical protein COX61_01870 
MNTIKGLRTPDTVESIPLEKLIELARKGRELMRITGCATSVDGDLSLLEYGDEKVKRSICLRILKVCRNSCLLAISDRTEASLKKDFEDGRTFYANGRDGLEQKIKELGMLYDFVEKTSFLKTIE